MLAEQGPLLRCANAFVATRDHATAKSRRPKFRYAPRTMFIPLGTTLDTPRRPLVVFTLVAVNVLLHVAVFTGTRSGNPQILEWFQALKLSFRDFHWWEPFSYQFLHDPTGIMHVAGNMIFLLAFGGVVENRLGKIGFLALYLVGGALSGLLQVVLTGGSVIGASGSVSVVAGAFLALHPRGHVHGLWLLPPSRVTISAAWLLGLYAAIDLVNTFTDAFGATRTGVGTIAHLAGLLFGLSVCVALLGTGILRRNDFDLFYMVKQWHRTRQLRAATMTLGLGTADGPVAARVRAGAQDTTSPNERRLRNTLAAAHRERDLVLAAQLYRELLAESPAASLPAALQLDVANQLAVEGDAQTARRAYTIYIERFRSEPARHDVRVMLAALELRRLDDPRAALATLAELDRSRLLDETRALAERLHAEATALAAQRPTAPEGAMKDAGSMRRPGGRA
jgi:membrane associated rhomboid family serine protease